MKILLVDDDEFVRTLLVKWLKDEGHEVNEENNVSDGMKALTEGDFDLLITDIVMPHVDGGKFMKAVRQQGMDIPIIAITGGVENAQEDYANYADMFADATLVKPIKKDELIETVNKLAG